MIQPLQPSGARWALDWQCLPEPVAHGGSVILPTCLFVVGDDARNQVLGTDLLAELDQRRAENLLVRLIDERGTPSDIFLRESGDWEPGAWERFQSDFHCKVHVVEAAGTGLHPLLDLLASTRGELAQRLVAAARKAAEEMSPTHLALGLVESTKRLFSTASRRDYLRAAVAIDPSCDSALVELADLDSADGRHAEAESGYAKAALIGQRIFTGLRPVWWRDPPTRVLMRALFGQMMALWNTGKIGDAARIAEDLLDRNPTDNQGVRFLLPLLYQLIEDHEAASGVYADYEMNYPGDYVEPSLWFGWGLSLSLDDEDESASEKYRRAMLANIYIAPLLLDLEEPTHHLWFPSDRAEPGYARDFFDAYALLWERDQTALRGLREVYHTTLPEIERLVDVRTRMNEFQDQRYDPRHREKWDLLLAEERALLGRGSSD